MSDTDFRVIARKHEYCDACDMCETNAKVIVRATGSRSAIASMEVKTDTTILQVPHFAHVERIPE